MAPTLRVRASSDSTPKKLRPKEPLYKESEKVLCKFKGQLYDAIVLEVKHVHLLKKKKDVTVEKSESGKNEKEKDVNEDEPVTVRSMLEEYEETESAGNDNEYSDQFAYFLHYRHWSSAWDEWVRSDCIVPISDESRKQQQELKLNAKKDKLKKTIKRKRRRGRRQSALNQSQNRESDDEESQMDDSSNVEEMDLQLSNPTQQSSEVISGDEEETQMDISIPAAEIGGGENEILKSGEDSQYEEHKSMMVMSTCPNDNEGTNEPMNDEAVSPMIDDSKVQSKGKKPGPRKRGRKPKKSKSKPTATVSLKENEAQDDTALKDAEDAEDAYLQNNESEIKIADGEEGVEEDLMKMDQPESTPKDGSPNEQSLPKDGEAKDDTTDAGVQISLKVEKTEDEEDPICSVKGTPTVNDVLVELLEYFVSVKSFEFPLSAAFVKTIGKMFESYCEKVASDVVKAKIKQVMLEKGVTLFGDVAHYSGLVALLDLFESGEWANLKVLADTHVVPENLDDLQVIFEACGEYVDSTKTFLCGKGSNHFTTEMEEDAEA